VARFNATTLWHIDAVEWIGVDLSTAIQLRADDVIEYSIIHDGVEPSAGPATSALLQSLPKG